VGAACGCCVERRCHLMNERLTARALFSVELPR
jgi:bacterioferritin-associated ferredoxin